jgi:hypothetical protein
MKEKGRVKLTCKRCQATFSTHSSNRDVCHKCRPKCREIHYFEGILKTQKKVEKEKKEKEQVSENKGKAKAKKTEEVK